MKAVERMKIRAIIVSKSTYFLIKWPQLISRLTFSKLRPNFRNQSQICDQTLFLSYFFVKKYLLVGASSMLWAGESVSGSVDQWISGSVRDVCLSHQSD